MAKVFYLRHQAQGVLTEFPFAQPPSDEQIAAVRQLCEAQHGTHHQKVRGLPDGHEDKVPFWLRVVEATIYGPTDIPVLEKPASARSVRGEASAGVTTVGVEAVGTVTNP